MQVDNGMSSSPSCYFRLLLFITFIHYLHHTLQLAHPHLSRLLFLIVLSKSAFPAFVAHPLHFLHYPLLVHIHLIFSTILQYYNASRRLFIMKLVKQLSLIQST